MATDFVLKTLKKRLFSSLAAFAATLEQHEKGKKGSKPSISVLKQKIDRMEEEYADDDYYDKVTADAVDAASRLFAEPTDEELALLKKMKEWAVGTSAQNDPKVRKLVTWLKHNIRPNKKWSNERVVIFTEYRATQKWLRNALSTEEFTGGDRLLTMYGGMGSKECEAVKAAFQDSLENSPVRILLATDAASAGLNLQNFCSKIIHYEIPWDPNRIEQRNGRIDRHGQNAKEVVVHYFVAKGYKKRQAPASSASAANLEADLDFLMRVAQDVETIREDIDSDDNISANRVEAAMMGREDSPDSTSQADNMVEPVRKILKCERNVAKRAQELLDQYDKTQKELRLSPENIQQVVEVALIVAGQHALVPANEHNRKPAFTFPKLDRSWAACAEGSEHPRTCIGRPITFHHAAAKGQDDVVLVHVNHRLVLMALHVLRDQMWSREGRKPLYRITARVVPDQVLDTLAVVAHARLVMIGSDIHRLHEEIIMAGGIITERGFSRMNVRHVEEAMAATAATAKDEEVPQTMKHRLLGSWNELALPLQQFLAVCMKNRTKDLRNTLSEREDKEANDIKAILTELKRAIEAELNNPEPELPDMTDQEKEQCEFNEMALRERVQAIPEEIERETKAIRARYKDIQSRMFPIAVTFLVPKTLAQMG
ncbi:MAG: SWF/SNF helicase family protein [Candidatus Nealsonbacteria bacterium]|nr:SWF/SNF helicase family protein [Candidatus Nealsonbacteria bacterium]